jgi:general secretion pathway protein C
MDSTQSLQRWIASSEARIRPILLRLDAVPLRYWQNLVIAIFSTWIVFTIGFFIADLVNQNSAADSTKSSSTRPSESNVATPIDIEAMVNWHLFGKSSGNAVATTPAPVTKTDDGSKNVGKTSLPVQLVGLMYAQDEKMARAILVINNDERQFLVGDTLPLGGNIKLHKVLVDRIIISNNGNLEALWLFDPDQQRMMKKTATVTQAAAPILNTPTQQPDESVQSGPLVQSAVQIVPAWGSDGKLQGYRINRGSNSAAFDSIGFSDGDIVTKINDTRMDNPQNAIQLYQQMQRGGTATFEVIRNGQAFTFQAELSQKNLFEEVTTVSDNSDDATDNNGNE